MSIPVTRGRRAAATAVGVVLFVAILIAALGLASLAVDEDVIASPGLGQLPGVVAVVAATAVVAVTIWSRMLRSGVWATLVVTALAGYLAYLAGLLAGAAAAASDVIVAASVVGRAATSWPGGAVIVAAVAAAGFALAVARGVGSRARWPWKHEDEREE